MPDGNPSTIAVSAGPCDSPAVRYRSMVLQSARAVVSGHRPSVFEGDTSIESRKRREFFTSRERLASQALEGFDIFAARLLHDVLGQAAAAGSPYPSPLFRASRERTVCRTTAADRRDDTTRCDQYRELSGVSTSSTSRSSPVSLVKPPLELGIGQDQPAPRACSAAIR